MPTAEELPITADFVTEKNDWSRFGMKYQQLPNCPLKETEIDPRFFNYNGTPNSSLTQISESVKATAEEILDDPTISIYVVGGVVGRFDKKDYHSDLDFYIKTKSSLPLDKTAGETRQTVDQDSRNLAFQIALKVNGGEIPKHPKDPRFVDIMLSAFFPFEYSPMEPGESEIMYDLANGAWVTVAPNVG